jgi:hypothetical protein
MKNSLNSTPDLLSSLWFTSFNNKTFWKELICLLSLHYLVVLGGVIVIVLATGPKVSKVQTWLTALDFKGNKNL